MRQSEDSSTPGLTVGELLRALLVAEFGVSDSADDFVAVSDSVKMGDRNSAVAVGRFDDLIGMVVVQAWLCPTDTNTTRILDQVSRLAEKGCLLLLFSVIIAVSFRDRHQLLRGSFTKEIFSFCMHALEDTFDDDRATMMKPLASPNHRFPTRTRTRDPKRIFPS